MASRIGRAALLSLVIGSGRLSAQAVVTEQRAIQRATLSAFADYYATKASAISAGRKLVLDPKGTPVRYGVLFEKMPDAEPAPRSAADLKDFAAALRGSVAVDSQLRRCTGTGPGRPCTTSPMDIVVIQVGDPVVTGNKATVAMGQFLTVTGLYGGRSSRPSPISDFFLVRLTRADSVWKAEGVNPLCVVTTCTRQGLP